MKPFNSIMSFILTPGNILAMSQRLSPCFMVYVTYPPDVVVLGADDLLAEEEEDDADGPPPFV